MKRSEKTIGASEMADDFLTLLRYTIFYFYFLIVFDHEKTQMRVSLEILFIDSLVAFLKPNLQ